MTAVRAQLFLAFVFLSIVFAQKMQIDKTKPAKGNKPSETKTKTTKDTKPAKTDKAKDSKSIETEKTEEDKPSCQKKKYEGNYKSCMANGTARTTCMDAMKAMMAQDASCERPDKVDEAKLAKDDARKALKTCLTSEGEKEDCYKYYETAIGKTLPKDKTKLENLMKKEAEKIAADALAEKMKDCKDQACRGNAKIAMEKLKGKNMTQAEFAHDIKKAGKSAAGDAVRACVQSATDAAAKRKCFSSDAAKRAAAEASGKDMNEVKDIDLKRAAKEKGKEEIAAVMDTCMSEAATKDAKKACRERSDLKQMIADSEGKHEGRIKDSDVRKWIKDGAGGDALLSAITCDKSDETALAKCRAEQKEAFAKAMGKDVGDISEDSTQKATKNAFRKDLADRMLACMEEAGSNETEIEACKSSVAKKRMKDADLYNPNNEPSKVEIERTLKKAGKSKAKDTMTDCALSRNECLALTMERTAQAMGKKKTNVKLVDAEVMALDGGFKAAREAAEACAEARKDAANATCDDFVEKFLEVRKLPKEVDPTKRKQQEKSVKRGAVVDLAKSNGRICLEKGSKEEVTQCWEGFRQDQDGVLDQLYEGMSEEKQKKMMATTQREATRQILGEDFRDCMEVATSVEEKKICADELKLKKNRAGFDSESENDLLRIFRGQQIANAALACLAENRTACKDDAKKQAVASGMKEREWARIKKKGSKEAAAKEWAACKQDNTATDTECEAQAKDAFETIFGSTDEAAWDAVKDKVKKIGEAKAEGVALKTVYKQQIDVDADTFATTCSSALTNSFLDSVSTLITTFTVNGKNLTDVKTSRPSCALVDANAALSAMVLAPSFTREEMDDASATIAEKLGSITLTLTGTRRLRSSVSISDLDEGGEFIRARQLASVSVSSAYATQGTELCASDDATCGQTETISPTPVPVPSPSTSTGAFLNGANGCVGSGAFFAFSALLALASLI